MMRISIFLFGIAFIVICCCSQEQNVDRLIGKLLHKNAEVRAEAAEALGHAGPEAKEAVPFLISALNDLDRDVRRNAAYALGDIGADAKEAVPALITALDDDSIDYAAASALGKIGPEPGVIPALIKALADGDRLTCGTAAEALGGFGPAAKDAVPALTVALDGSNYEAVEALGKICAYPKISVPALIEALEDESGPVRAVVAIAIGEFGPNAQDAVPQLIWVLKYDDYFSARAFAADALGCIGPAAKEAVPVLIDILYNYHNDNDSTRLEFDYSIRALGNIGPDAKDALPVLQKIVDFEDYEGPRKLAQKAIEKIKEIYDDS